MIIRYLTSYFDQSKQMEIEANRLYDMKIANFLGCNGLIIDVPFVNSLLVKNNNQDGNFTNTI
jgi:hypothetical protein